MTANHVFTFAMDAAPAVATSVPANGTGNIATNANVSITFSENVDATGASFTIACATSGAHTFALAGGPLAYVLNPDVDFTPGETCTVTAHAAQVTDQDANDPPDTMLADHVFSFTLEQAPSVTATSPSRSAPARG